jgi:hypothetical protein
MDNTVIEHFYKRFRMPKYETTNHYYSFDLNELHIVSINSEIFLIEKLKVYIAGLLDWLVKDLQRTFKPWKVVIMHHSLYCLSEVKDRCTTQSKELRGFLEDIFLLYKVNLVLAGKDRNYQRSYPINKEKTGKPLAAENNREGMGQQHGDKTSDDTEHVRLNGMVNNKFEYLYDDPIGPVYLVCSSAGSSAGLDDEIVEELDTLEGNKLFAHINVIDVGVCKINANMNELAVSFISSLKETVLDRFVIKPYKG